MDTGSPGSHRWFVASWSRSQNFFTNQVNILAKLYYPRGLGLGGKSLIFWNQDLANSTV
jgi:hypothetical protein